MLFFDRQTDSLWSQLLSQAVTGPLAGTRLSVLPVENTTWGKWRKAHPRADVMSFVTGYPYNYGEDPYAQYPFPRNPALFVSCGGATRIFPFSELRKSKGAVTMRCEGEELKVRFDRRSKTARVKSGRTQPVVSFVAYLDDLEAFHPEAEVYKAPQR